MHVSHKNRGKVSRSEENRHTEIRFGSRLKKRRNREKGSMPWEEHWKLHAVQPVHHGVLFAEDVHGRLRRRDLVARRGYGSRWSVLFLCGSPVEPGHKLLEESLVRELIVNQGLRIGNAMSLSRLCFLEVDAMAENEAHGGGAGGCRTVREGWVAGEGEGQPRTSSANSTP